MHRLSSTAPRGRGARGSSFVALSACLTFAVACSDTVIIEPSDGGAGSGAEGGGGQGGVGNAPTGGAIPMPTGGGGDGPDPIVDPGCPNKPEPLELFDCDPYDQKSGDCGFGEACYIFVEYPVEACGQEVYGATCLPAGVGQQGDNCFGATSCAPGFVCVVSGSGTQCVELCNLSGASGCPAGLVCEAIDVQGFGGCL